MCLKVSGVLLGLSVSESGSNGRSAWKCCTVGILGVDSVCPGMSGCVKSVSGLVCQ